MFTAYQRPQEAIVNHIGMVSRNSKGATKSSTSSAIKMTPSLVPSIKHRRKL